MPLPTITDVTRLALSGTLPSGASWTNVLHFRWGGGGTPSTANFDALFTQVDKLYGGPAYGAGEYLMRRCPTATKLLNYVFTPLDGVTPSYSRTSTKVGGSVAQGTPPEISQVLTLYTTVRGRSGRGRVFLPNWTIEAYDAAGQPGTTILNAAVSNTQAFIAALPAITWDWVVASYLHSDSHDLTAITMHAATAAQRRRRGRYP